MTDTVAGIHTKHTQFVFDVEVAAPVNAQSQWARFADSAHLLKEDGFFRSAERKKYTKHEEPYARLNIGVLAFAVSSFCVLGPTLLRYLALLAECNYTLGIANNIRWMPYHLLML